MGSTISVHNDTSSTKRVWFQLLGGGPPAGGYDETWVSPGGTVSKKFTLSLYVEVCIEHGPCVEEQSPSLANHENTIQLSNLLDEPPSLLSASLTQSSGTLTLQNVETGLGSGVPFVLAILLFMTLVLGFMKKSSRRRTSPSDANVPFLA